MSRCFPFPPPGYEIEARNNHGDQLAKGNHKEKKHKKEKRDKEKREGKERKDRDRSKDKHKDKKHRKEKHEEKKKEDRDKYHNRTSNDRRNKGQSENHNEEKLRDTSGRMAEEVKDSKFTEDLDRRIRDEKMGPSQRMSETFSDSTQRRTENLCSASTSASASAIKKEQNNGNEMVGVGSSREHGRINGLGRPDGNFEGQVMKGKRKSKNKGTDSRKGDKHEDRDTEETRNKGNDNRRDKEKEKEKELVRGKDHENKSNAKPKVCWKNDQVDCPNFNPLALHANNEKYVGPDGDINKKSKDFKINGFSHENDMQPNKIPRPAYSSHPHVENGRAMESCHIASDSSIGHQAKSIIKAEVINNVESKINGKARNQLSSIDLKPSVSVDACQNGGASLKRSHPDSKFLTQIYSVPKMEDWPESDDQECHIATDSSIVHQAKSNSKEKVINNVESKINGKSTTPISSVDLKPSVVVGTCQNGGGSLKRSHPDCKYLDQTYSVPKMEDWPESDDQECHIATDSSIVHQAKSNSTEKVVNNVESKINGKATTLLSLDDLKPSVVVGTCQNGGGSLKRSHPDSKYLDQIYSVPKMEDWPESDDQEWLFDKDNPLPKIKKMNVVKETGLVWSETLQIKSADVFSLPYVIPY